MPSVVGTVISANANGTVVEASVPKMNSSTRKATAPAISSPRSRSSSNTGCSSSEIVTPPDRYVVPPSTGPGCIASRIASTCETASSGSSGVPIAT